MAFKPLDGSMEVFVRISLLKKGVMTKRERLDSSPDDHLCPLVKDCVLSHIAARRTGGAGFLSHAVG